MSRLGGFGIPGTGAAEATVEREIMWGGDDRRILALWKSSVIDGASRDAGSTPTTYLRRGLLLGQVAASLKEKQWDSQATDGTQNLAGVLDIDLKAVDFDGNNADRSVRRLVSGPVRAGQLLIKGVALVGHADEFLARRQMVASGFKFDDDPFGYYAGQGGRVVLTTGAVAVVPKDNGTTFYGSGANTTFTLPAIQPGLEYVFTMFTDHALAVVSAAGDDIIVGNDSAADSVTFNTAGKQIGAMIRVRSMYAPGPVLRWLLDLPSPAFGTGFTGGLAYAIAT